MLQIISTFSSFAAPTRTTLSVAQIGASMKCKMFVFTLIMTCQYASVVIKMVNVDSLTVVKGVFRTLAIAFSRRVSKVVNYSKHIQKDF